MFDFEECKKYIEKCNREGFSIQWNFIATSFKLPIDFILEHEDKLDFNYLIMYQGWDENIIRIFHDKIPWDHVNPNNYSKEFCREFKNKFKFDFWSLNKNIQKELGKFEDYDEQISKIKKRNWFEKHKNDFKK